MNKAVLNEHMFKIVSDLARKEHESVNIHLSDWEVLQAEFNWGIAPHSLQQKKKYSGRTLRMSAQCNMPVGIRLCTIKVNSNSLDARRQSQRKTESILSQIQKLAVLMAQCFIVILIRNIKFFQTPYKPPKIFEQWQFAGITWLVPI